MVGEALAHMHNVRLMWLKVAAPDLLAGLEKMEKGSSISSAGLIKALDASGAAITELVARSLGSGRRVKGFKPRVHAFVGYRDSLLICVSSVQDPGAAWAC